jgi:ribosome-binding factor A
MVSKVRSQRIADRIREELSEMMIQEVHDPRLVGVMVTDVTVDRELAYADVYVSSLEGSERAPEAITALEHAGGFLRTELAKRVDLRIFPRLRFHWDPTPERADHMEKLFKAMQAESETQAKPPTSNDSPEGDQDG